MNLLLKIIFCFCLMFRYCLLFTGELFPFQTPSNCKLEEYYSVNTLMCKPCAKDKFLIPSENSTLK